MVGGIRGAAPWNLWKETIEDVASLGVPWYLTFYYIPYLMNLNMKILLSLSVTGIEGTVPLIELIDCLINKFLFQKGKVDKDKEASKRVKDRESGVARGIDFQFVANVINFDFPKVSPPFYNYLWTSD
jgi:hypothetical protein